MSKDTDERTIRCGVYVQCNTMQLQGVMKSCSLLQAWLELEDMLSEVNQ